MNQQLDEPGGAALPVQPTRRGGRLLWLVMLLVAVAMSLAGVLSYYVDALWYESLGYAAVF